MILDLTISELRIDSFAFYFPSVSREISGNLSFIPEPVNCLRIARPCMVKLSAAVPVITSLARRRYHNESSTGEGPRRVASEGDDREFFLTCLGVTDFFFLTWFGILL